MGTTKKLPKRLNGFNNFEKEEVRILKHEMKAMDEFFGDLENEEKVVKKIKKVLKDAVKHEKDLMLYSTGQKGKYSNKIHALEVEIKKVEKDLETLNRLESKLNEYTKREGGLVKKIRKRIKKMKETQEGAEEMLEYLKKEKG